MCLGFMFRLIFMPVYILDCFCVFRLLALTLYCGCIFARILIIVRIVLDSLVSSYIWTPLPSTADERLFGRFLRG